MFAYYLDLALRSFRRNKALTALMVLAIALGIGASMTTLTVFHVLSGDPIPQKSDKLFFVQLDPAGKDGYTPGEEPADQLTRFDAETLLRQHRGVHQAMMTGGSAGIEPQRAGHGSVLCGCALHVGGFLPDVRRAVPVRQRLVGDRGRKARARGGDRQGPQPRSCSAAPTASASRSASTSTTSASSACSPRGGRRRSSTTCTTTASASSSRCSCRSRTSRDLEMDRSGSMDCWDDNKDSDDPEGETGVNAPCTWIQYWVQLDTPAQAAAYHQYLVNYSDQQRASGRFERPTNVRLRDVMAWLDFNKIVPGDVRLQLWLAFGFLLVCLLNTVGLLLAKFLRRSSEIGVRRALGASRRAIFAQCLVEAGTIGLVGGVLGLGLALLGLWAVRQQPNSYDSLAHLDVSMLLATFVLAIVASLLAGVLPAWRACQVAPAIQLKSQ